MQGMLWRNSGGDGAEKLTSLQQQIRTHPAIRDLSRSVREPSLLCPQIKGAGCWALTPQPAPLAFPGHDGNNDDANE